MKVVNNAGSEQRMIEVGGEERVADLIAFIGQNPKTKADILGKECVILVVLPDRGPRPFEFYELELRQFSFVRDLRPFIANQKVA